jgi:Tol biopolymer transport system component
MKRFFVIVIAALMASGMPTAGARQGAAEAEKLLASAKHKATIDGDPKAAIEEYKRAFAAAGSNRGLAADALLRMAECHQQLGEAEAQAIYERVIRDYADQKDAVVMARARIAPRAAGAPVKGDRSVWTGFDADGFGTISPDGRFLTYTDWKNGASLAVRDLTTGTSHRLTSGGQTQFSAISRDGKQVAYDWYGDVPTNGGRAPYELRLARLNGTNLSESRRLFQNDEVIGAAPFDWSPDGNWIAVGVGKKDGTHQIGLVGVRDGALRVLKSVDWKSVNKIFFSPDGRYIVYDLEATDDRTDRHVFVTAVDGSHETAVVAHASENTIMGWSPDGRHVLFSSDRSGSVGLWAVSVENGRPTGAPILLKSDIASSWSLGLTAAGTMYVWKYASPVYVQASSIDLAAGKLSASPASFQKFITSRGRPAWSADGKHLAFQSCDPLGAGPCSLWIRSMETGQLRELKPKLGYFGFVSWSPDGRELLTGGRDLKGRNQGLYRIDVKTGNATLVAPRPLGGNSPQWGPSGTHLYYRRGASIMERDLASGTEREVSSIPTPGVGGFGLSPDGRAVAFDATDASGAKSLFVMPIARGTPRPVFRPKATDQHIGRWDWTSDGQAIAMALRRGDSETRELWIVDVDSGRARKLDVDIGHWIIEDGFHIDRAGTQIAFVANAGQPGLEIRALENFLPRRAAAKSPAPLR